MEFRYRIWVGRGEPKTIRVVAPPVVDGGGGKGRRFRLVDGAELIVPFDTRYEEIPTETTSPPNH